MKPLTIFIGLILFSASSSAAFFGKDDDPAKEAEKISEAQNSTRKMRDEILEELYELNPETKGWGKNQQVSLSLTRLVLICCCCRQPVVVS